MNVSPLLMSDLTLTGYVVAGLFALAFITRYARTQWRRHPWGRHVMAFMSLIVVLVGTAVVGRVLGDYPGRLWVLLMLAWTFAAILGWRYVLLARGERDPNPPSEPPREDDNDAPLHPRSHRRR